MSPRSLLLGVVVASAAWLTIGALDAPPAGKVGRYRIVGTTSASFSMVQSKPVEVNRPVVFKLDTTTGETWQWLDITVNGQMTQAWQPCRTLPEHPTTKPDTGN